jgi:ATP-dependent Clp protease ATP-binding subunit ClpC
MATREAAGPPEAYDREVFERFTDRARRVVVWAQEQARLLNHNYIGTEHLLLGLLAEEEGVAARALGALDISLDRAREKVELFIGVGTGEAEGHIPFTPRAKKTLELSLREALDLGHNFIGTEHILLGLVRDDTEATMGMGVGMQVLRALGAEPDAVRRQVMALISESGPESVRGQAWSRPAASSQDPPTGPLCSQCRALTEETAKTAVVTIPGPEGESLPVVAVYCGMCGATYGLLPALGPE